MHQDAILRNFCDHSLREMQPTPHPADSGAKNAARMMAESKNRAELCKGESVE